ncbi:MAG: dephospho-CoA kinase [Kiritimatiellae bacterium]|nr:dephospho-CoA kinase [Kiritimatiellia bacterium]
MLQPRIAITGGIACGKSLFASLLEKRGVEILDADAVVHQLEGPGGEAVPVVAARFGQAILNPDGGVDRTRLAEIVFADPVSLERLNAILHPMVKERIDRWITSPATHFRAVMVPLLFEIGWDRGWDVIICLASDEAVQVDRMVRLRGYSEAQARQRLASQWPVAQKAARSDIVVWNNGDVDALAQETERVFRMLQEKCL